MNLPIYIPDFIINSWQEILFTGFALLIVTIVSFFISACCVYTILLTRTRPEKWSRKCSTKEQSQMQMYDEGLLWAQQNKEFCKQMRIMRDGIELYGEYYDFGNRKAMILIPGRSEALCYGYYYAKPYAENGYNVFVMDQRAHGLSGGKYNTVGFEESKDLIAWVKILHDKHQVESVVFHGICIGSACALYALTNPACPDYVTGLVAEGMYSTFYKSFWNHMAEKNGPVFPVMPMVSMLMKYFTGHNMRHGPIHVIDQLKKPILMIHCKTDPYSVAEDADILYEKCKAPKAIVWYDDGEHSKLRLKDQEKYDASVQWFLQTHTQQTYQPTSV